MFDISEYEVLLAIKSLKNSWGHDDTIENNQIIYKLYNLFIINRSFEEGIFPDNLKSAITKPLSKKGDTSDPNSYRPITILSTFSKIFEKNFCDRLSYFFSKFNISQSQHGFVRK